VKIAKAWWLLLAVLACDFALLPWLPEMAFAAGASSLDFLWEIAGILPPVLLLLGLFDVWVPRKLVESNIGPESGAKGALLSILLGSLAAGPLFAAFPIALSLLRKGGRLGNIAMFLGAWAAIKLPMILLEASYLGLRFSLLRTGLSIVGIIASGWIVERLVPKASIPGAV